VNEDSAIRDPRKRTEALALRKAESVAKSVKKGWVLGADTLVALGSRIFGKPVNAHDAYRMLYRLSGTTQRVITGVALVDAETGRSLVRSAVSKVYMKKLELDAILTYSRRHMDKAGAYAIQEKKDPVAKVVEGSYDNVVGLPVSLVREMLRDFAKSGR
jgi:septum formation protein